MPASWRACRRASEPNLGLFSVQRLTFRILAKRGRTFVVASVSNLAFKGGIALSMGSLCLFRVVAPLFGGIMAASLAAVLFWP